MLDTPRAEAVHFPRVSTTDLMRCMKDILFR
jgi:hypothetical protein